MFRRKSRDSSKILKTPHKSELILDRNVSIPDLKAISEETGYSEAVILKTAINYLLFAHNHEFSKLVIEPRGSDFNTEQRLTEWAVSNRDAINRQFWPIADSFKTIRVLSLEMDKRSYTITIEHGKVKYGR